MENWTSQAIRRPSICFFFKEKLQTILKLWRSEPNSRERYSMLHPVPIHLPILPVCGLHFTWHFPFMRCSRSDTASVWKTQTVDVRLTYRYQPYDCHLSPPPCYVFPFSSIVNCTWTSHLNVSCTSYCVSCVCSNLWIRSLWLEHYIDYTVRNYFLSTAILPVLERNSTANTLLQHQIKKAPGERHT